MNKPEIFLLKCLSSQDVDDPEASSAYEDEHAASPGIDDVAQSAEVV